MACRGNRGIVLFLAAALPGARCFEGYPCSEKPTFLEISCPVATRAACWTLVSDVAWKCLDVPPPGVGEGEAAWDVYCKAEQMPAGSPEAYYDGICTFGEEVPASSLRRRRLKYPLTWEEARRKAQLTLQQMTPAEKYSLMQGQGWEWPEAGGWWDLKKWWYVGNTPAVERLGIPNLNMQDSAGGFRPYWHELVGTVTGWPSQLSLAACWDPDLVRQYSSALAEEFKLKGANVVLGPSVNVHRVARNGRNFEYLSGEDPYLGAKLAEPWVEGMQSKGVMAVVKHWIFNEQETHRGSEDSQVDEKTSWEVYYPPFEAAVNAGVAAAMCSYNRVNGVHSCHSAEQLTVLKQVMGFQGFVQSDWWALHGMSVKEGCDQDMPGIADAGIGNPANCTPEYQPPCSNATWYSPQMLSKQPQELIDEAVTRILSAMFHLDIQSSCAPPNCKDWFLKNVTTPQHSALARFIAAESVVLLKNADDVLPIGKRKPVRRIAVIGAAAVAKPYDPNGVGQGKGEWNMGDDYSGGGSGHIALSNVVNPLQAITERAKKEKMEVVSSTTNTTSDATKAAEDADLILVVGACFGKEMADRPDLNLWDNADDIIAALVKAGHGPKMVVLMQVPGAVLTPWRHKVAGILMMFPGGQATGLAWSDILFGDRPPSGRLPVMMPASEEDVIEPGTGKTVAYSEGMKTSYRNPDFAAAYPFGHGLTYTRFEYLDATFEECGEEGGIVCIRCPVRNAGAMAARAVPQLYVEMPPEAGHPTYILKGFHKTSVLPPEASQDVVFRLTARDLSYYDEASHSWQQASSVTALVGESSRDIRLRLPVQVQGTSSFNFLWILPILLGLCALAVCAAVIWRVIGNSRQAGLFSACASDNEDSDEDYESELEDSEAAVLGHLAAKDMPMGHAPRPL